MRRPCGSFAPHAASSKTRCSMKPRLLHATTQDEPLQNDGTGYRIALVSMPSGKEMFPQDRGKTQSPASTCLVHWLADGTLLSSFVGSQAADWQACWSAGWLLFCNTATCDAMRRVTGVTAVSVHDGRVLTVHAFADMSCRRICAAGCARLGVLHTYMCSSVAEC